MRFILFVLMISCFSIAGNGQSDYKIKAQNVKVTKAAIPGLIIAEYVKWSNMDSKCMSPGEFTIGNWISLKPKEPKATIYLYGEKFDDDIAGAVIYLGQVNDQNVLEEVDCVRAGEGEKELFLSFNNLTPKAQYYIFIARKDLEAGKLQHVFVKPEYKKKEVIISKEVASKRKIFGRVFDNDNQPKPLVLVTLLNQRMQPIESVESGTDGTFKFLNLPAFAPVLARIDDENKELALDMFLVEADGAIGRRGRKIGDNLFGFELIENEFNDLILLSENDWKLDVDKGTIGVAGKLVDAETYLQGKPDVEICLYNEKHEKTNSTKTDARGIFAFRNLEVGQYNVKIEDEDDGTYSEIVMVDDLNVPFEYANSEMMDESGLFEFKALPADVVKLKRMEEEDSRLSIGIDFSKVSEGEAIILNQILFESASVTLLPSSFEELDMLAKSLKANTAINIEIDGHTDNQGSAEYNKTLSQGRAESVKDYLVNHGIDASRLIAKGYGEEHPVATNDTEEGREKNRRVSVQKI